MAQAIGCDLCQQESAVMMQSNLTNGDTIGVGESCMVTFFASSLAAMLSDAPPDMLNALSVVLEPLAAIIGPEEWVKDSDQVKAEAARVRAEHDQAEADAMASEPDPAPPGDEMRTLWDESHS